jgi:hypothetical protein
MAGEIQCSYKAAVTLYGVVRSPQSGGMVWDNVSGYFTTYNTTLYSNYSVSLTQQGTASAYYVGNFPTGIAPGTYNVVAKQQLGGSPAEADPTVAQGQLEWNGTRPLPLSDLVTSGQFAQSFPIPIAYGTMVRDFGIYFKSSVDHVTPFTSGVVSGQIVRGSGTWGPLQSGAFVEVGNGFYNLQALTSGDLAATTVKLLFTANGISGLSADPVAMTIVTQRVSGVA